MYNDLDKIYKLKMQEVFIFRRINIEKINFYYIDIVQVLELGGVKLDLIIRNIV